jgi:hypothetical protein
MKVQLPEKLGPAVLLEPIKPLKGAAASNVPARTVIPAVKCSLPTDFTVSALAGCWPHNQHITTAALTKHHFFMTPPKITDLSARLGPKTELLPTSRAS